jgi:hypothetical protein
VRFLLVFVSDFILGGKHQHFQCVDKTEKAQRTVNPLGISINM